MANRYDIQEAYYKYALDNGLGDIAARIEDMGFQPVDSWEAESTNAAIDKARALHYSEALTSEGAQIYEGITMDKSARTISRSYWHTAQQTKYLHPDADPVLRARAREIDIQIRAAARESI